METYEQLKIENQLCFPLYASARKIVNLYTPHLKKLGVTYTQYIALMILWDKKEVTVGDLCEKLYLDTGTITPLLKKLQEQGLVEKTRNTEDERGVVIKITDAGMELREKAKEIPGCVGGCVPFTQEEAVLLYKLLYKILDN